MKVGSSISTISTVFGALSLLATALPANAINFVGTSSGGTIGASGNSDFTLSFTSPNTGTINSVTLLISSLTAADLGTVELFLSSPNNNQLQLLGLGSNTGTTYTSVIFDDLVSTVIFNAPADPTGSFQPEGGLGSFVTANFATLNDFTAESLGTGNRSWKLSVFNSDPTNSVSLGNVTLNVDATPVPFEFDGSAGMAIVGGAFVLNRWHKKRKSSVK